MPTNIELKARVSDAPRLRAVVAALVGSPQSLEQHDTFFRVPRGRLKLRETELGAELIRYDREDAAGLRSSEYEVVAVPDPVGLRRVLSAALGMRGEVRKRREVYLAGQTRIHLDRVEGLGDFVELEVVLRPGQPSAEGEAIAADLARRLGVEPADMVAGAYIDLLEARAATTTRG
jgi:predicted adenylyl cyclase CyaB